MHMIGFLLSLCPGLLHSSIMFCSFFLEFILDEAKVKLSVSYIKGVPMPDEIKVTKLLFL